MTETVMIEKKAHDMIWRLLQDIWEKHRLCITDVSAGWLCIDEIPHPNMILRKLRISSETKEIELEAKQNAPEYDRSITYNQGDTVIGSDGHAYRCK